MISPVVSIAIPLAAEAALSITEPKVTPAPVPLEVTSRSLFNKSWVTLVKPIEKLPEPTVIVTGEAPPEPTIILVDCVAFSVKLLPERILPKRERVAPWRRVIVPAPAFKVVRAFTKVVPPEVKSIFPVLEVIELPMLIPAVVSRSISEV